MQKEVKHQVLVSVTVIFFFGLLFFFGVYWLKTGTSGLVADIIGQHNLIQQRSNLTETLAVLRKEKQVGGMYSQVLNSLVASRDELFVDFSRWLDQEALAYQVGASFSFQGTEVAPSAGNLGYAEFSLKLTGNFKNIVNFLSYLETSSKRFLLSFNGFDVAQGVDNYNVSVGGRVFFGR